MYVELEYLKFKNVLSYGAKEVTHTFEPGLTAISGRNGAGKSTFLEVISYNWFGKPYRKIKLAALLNRENKKGLETETGICIDHRDHYRIIRNMKPDKLQIFKNGEPFEMLSSKTLDQEDITKILGIDYKMFKQIVSLAVTYNKPFLTQEAAEKREIVEAIFNIKIIGEMLTVLKKKITTEKVKYTVNKKTVEMLEENINLMRKNIIEVKKSVAEFETSKSADLSKISNSITDMLRQIAELENEITSCKNRMVAYTTDKSGIAANIAKRESNLATMATVADITPEAIKLTAEIADLTNKINALPQLLLELQKAPSIETVADAARDGLVAERDTVIATGNQLKKEIELFEAEHVSYNDDKEYAEILSPYESLRCKKEDITSVLNTVCGEQKPDSKLMALGINHDTSIVEKSKCEQSTKDEIEYIEYLKTNDVCKKCKSTITPEFRDQEIKSSQVVVDSNTIRVAELNEGIKNINSCRETIYKLISELAALDKQSAEISAAAALRKAAIDNEKQKKIAAMKNDLNTLKIRAQTITTAIEDRNKALAAEHEKRISHIKTEQTNLELQKNIKTAELANMHKEKRNAAEKEIASLKSELERTEVYLKNETDSISRNEKLIASVAEQLKNSEMQRKEISERKPTFDIPGLEAEFTAKISDFKTAYAENAVMADNLKVYDITAAMLSEEGIKSFFFKRLTPILNAKINEYLDKFDIPVRCEFNEQMEERIYNIANENEEVSYYSYSEGEKKSIDTAILMSFIDITKVICNWNCNILLIDELIDGQVDFPRLEKMFECLREFSGSGMIPSIYIISHRALDDIQAFFKRIITVNKVDGFSELTMKKCG